jgi:hypothetical protein
MTTDTAYLLTGEPDRDRFGRTFFRIPLSGRDGAGRYALVDADGARALRKAGARSLFLVSDAQGRSYVSFVRFPSRQPMTAARCIMGDPRRHRIEYVNGDRLDLRKENLHVRPYAGVGERRAAEAA